MGSNDVNSERGRGDEGLSDEGLHVRMLRSRASSLKAQAKALPEPLAQTYRRRARELVLEAYLIENATLLARV